MYSISLRSITLDRAERAADSGEAAAAGGTEEDGATVWWYLHAGEVRSRGR